MSRTINGGFKVRPGQKLKTNKGPITVRPLRARYATPPPSAVLTWLETAHFLPDEGITVLLAWPRTAGFTFRTGRFSSDKWRLSNGNEPREKPTFFASIND